MATYGLLQGYNTRQSILDASPMPTNTELEWLILRNLRDCRLRSFPLHPEKLLPRREQCMVRSAGVPPEFVGIAKTSLGLILGHFLSAGKPYRDSRPEALI